MNRSENYYKIKRLERQLQDEIAHSKKQSETESHCKVIFGDYSDEVI